MWSAVVEWGRRWVAGGLWSSEDRLRARLAWVIGGGGGGWLVGLYFLGGYGDMAVVRGLSHANWVNDHRALIQAISDGGMYPFYVLFLGILGYAARYRLSWPRAVALGWLWAELLGAGLTVQVLKFLTGRARPDQAWISGGIDQWLGPTLQAAYHSFPSGHTADLFVSAAFTVLLLRPPWMGLLAWLVAFAVALSRIALAKHYLSDVLVGILVAEITTWLVIQRWLRMRNSCVLIERRE
ncbi:acidPPc domain-containing protein [Gammaproteobacteria bacterium]